MRLMIRLAVIGLLVGLAGPGYAWTIPWKTFSESARDGRGAEMAGCPDGQGGIKEVYRAYMSKDGHGYQFLFGVESWRIMFFVYKGDVDGAAPDEVGVGIVDKDKHDEIPPLKWMSLDEAKSKYPNPCSFLVGQDDVRA